MKQSPGRGDRMAKSREDWIKKAVAGFWAGNALLAGTPGLVGSGAVGRSQEHNNSTRRASSPYLYALFFFPAARLCPYRIYHSGHERR